MKKIMFNDRFGLTKAVLEGRKTMTRRIMIPQPSWVSGAGHTYNDSKPSAYKVGEVVAVSQCYNEVLKTCNFRPTFLGLLEPKSIEIISVCGYTNKMYVRAELMPHHIRITDLKVERLQDITDEDCMREGIIRFTCNLHEYRGICYSFDGDKNRMGTFQTPREAFACLIDKISGKGTWESNPYVYVYSFNKLIQ